MERTIWSYSQQIGTGAVVTGIGIATAVAAPILGNLWLGVLAYVATAVGLGRINYARGMRDMHAIDTNLPAGQKLKDFHLTAEDEDNGH